MRYRDNPSAVSPLRVDPDAPDAHRQMLGVANAIVPEWEHVHQAQVTVVGGGITNRLFALAAEGCPPLLVRVYGDNTEVVIDRESENALFATLSQCAFAPTYHGRFVNGRVEGLLEGTRALEPHEMAEARFVGPIAQCTRQLHGIPLPSALKPEPQVWVTLRGWMDQARAVRFEGVDAERHAALDLERFDAALSVLEGTFHASVLPAATSLGARAAVRPVLAHNDLLSGNILVDPAGAVRFIDYEYGACAYAAFDVANHFCEYAGFDSDFETHFPRAEARERFIRGYLPDSMSPDDVRDFRRVVDFFVLPDHLWWGCWAVIQARYSPIDFDFLGYAQLRLQGFRLHEAGLGS
jgi:ethanolamine kinase